MSRVQVSAIACRSTVLLGFWLGSISTGHADLVAHWKLDEGDGEVFADSAAGSDGFLPQGITVEWGEGPPIQENAVRFLGSSSFIATEFPGIGGGNPRTVAFWFRTTDTSAYFLAWGANRTGEKWHIRLNGGSGVIRTEFQGGQNFATTNLLDGEWHHVASVFPEGATEGGELLHYVDGVLDPQAGGNSVTINTAVGDGSADWADGNSTGSYFVHFGAVLAHGFGRMLDGSMADVRIYDEALDEAAIQDVMTAGRCLVGRTIGSVHYVPGGDPVTVTLEARGVSGKTTITETFPDGLAVGDAGGGTVNGNTIAFSLTADGTVSYTLTTPDDFCEEISLSGAFTGAGDSCEGNVFGRSAVACAFGCSEVRERGAVPAMLIIGPIDLGGNAGPQCDDNGNLGFTDYLRSADGSVNEANLEVVFGDEIEPDFLGAAGGVGVAFASNPDINPRIAEGILTVWIADADANGRINFNDADNLGTPLDDYVIYSVVYLDNTTGDALPVTLRVGSDDAVKVLVNGEQVWLNAVCRGVPGVDASDPVAVVLEPGINTVLIAVVERGGGTDVRLLVYDEFNSVPLDDGSVVACLVAEEPDIMPPGERFVRGDADANGSINLTDGIVVLNFLFLGGTAPRCMDAADVDDSGGNNPTLTDAVVIFNWLFSGGVPPSEPTPSAPNYVATDCGVDPTEEGDQLDCASPPMVCRP